MSNYLGSKIKRIRDKNKLSQTRFGSRIGVSGKTVSAYEKGKISPTYKVLEKITNTYDVSIVATQQQKDYILRRIEKISNLLEEIKLRIDL